jgi:hypothetical protein
VGACCGHDGGCDIETGADCCEASIRRDTWTAQHQGNPQRWFVADGLAGVTVLTEQEPVVGRHNHQGVTELSDRAEGVKHRRDCLVNGGKGP